MEQRPAPDMPYLAGPNDLKSLNNDGQKCEVCDNHMHDHNWAIINPGGFVMECSMTCGQSNLLIQLELALHDADCNGHDSDFTGHGDKYTKMAQAAISVFPPEREPYWLRDRKMVQESALNLIFGKLNDITNRVGA